MSRFSTQVRIDASKEKVWEVLADLGGIYKWNPGVVHSHSPSDSTGGEGAMRHCDLQRKGDYLEERAFDWREGEGYTIDVYESSLPMKNTVEFAIKPEGGGTRVYVTVNYRLKYGPVGALLDVLFVRRPIQKGFDQLVAGLKYHFETGGPVDDKVPR